MPYRTANNLAQYVTAALISRENTVSDEKSRGSSMIRNNAERCSPSSPPYQLRRGLRRNFLLIIYSAKFGGALQQRDEEVGGVDRHDALEDRGDAFQAHARIDGGFGQRR